MTLKQFDERQVKGSIVPTTSNADVFRMDGVSDTNFIGAIASKPGGSVLTYTVTGGTIDQTLWPPTADHLGKIVLHNTTRGTSALIDNCDVLTKTITLTADVPTGWLVGDVITARSQTITYTNGAAYFYDIDLSSADNNVIPASAQAILVGVTHIDAGATKYYTWVHPYESFSNNKIMRVDANASRSVLVPLINQRFCILVRGSGPGAVIALSRLMAVIS